MYILSDTRSQNNWITAIIDGHWCQAKVFDVGSGYGINFGRVSKLSVGKSAERDRSQNFLNQTAYHYDRGLDFDDLPPGVLDSIVAQLEALPKAFIE